VYNPIVYFISPLYRRILVPIIEILIFKKLQIVILNYSLEMPIIGFGETGMKKQKLK